MFVAANVDFPTKRVNIRPAQIFWVKNIKPHWAVWAKKLPIKQWAKKFSFINF